MSVKFLSDDWFEELAARLARATPAGDGTAIRIGQIARETPSGGEVRWTIVLEPGKASRIDRSPTAEADVMLTGSYDSLRKLASGELTAAQLLAAGGLKLSGEISRLVGAADFLETVSTALGPEPS